MVLSPPPPPTNSYLETELERGSHSLPSVEEARTQGALSGANRHSGKSKRTIAMVAMLVAVIALVVGFSVATVQNNKNSSSKSSSAQDLNGDGDTLDEGEEDAGELETDDVVRLDQVHIFLLGSAISSESDLKDTSKPQYKAAQWIANEDDWDIPETNDYDTAYSFVQRYVMAVFYYALDGPNWTNSLNFLSTDLDTCEWNVNIEVKDPPPGTDETNFDFGVSCWDEEIEDYSDAVTYIFITNNKLKGSLPSEVGELLDLVHLSLFHNQISGSIPDTMQKLESLNYWAMEHNQISGKVPSWIAQMPSLTDLALGSNMLTGELPSFVGSVLEELSLESNNLGGSIDPLNDARALTIAYLEDNMFQTTLSESTWSNLDNLDIVDLSQNQLEGSFPSGFYWFSQIDLSNNFLTSMSIVAPDNFQEMPTLFLSVADNEMEGPMPHNIGALLQLVTLDLSRNGFTGTIPLTIASLTNLEALYLGQNPELTGGTIPDLRECTSMVELSLAQTNRDGYIHSWIADTMTDLVLLDLRGNMLMGPIPTNLGDLEFLKTLYLNVNSLTGTVPPELGSLPSLVDIAINNNEITGDMSPVCEGDADDLNSVAVDAGITCDCDCIVCDATDTTCNLMEDQKFEKGYADIDRDVYLQSEDIAFVDASSVTP